VAAGRFRQDLYFRLNVVTIDVPPLRERREEIPALVEAYLEELRQRKATAVQGFSAAALAIFQQYTWPGNLRELKNVVERVAVLCEHAVIEPQDLPRQVLAACEAEKPADHQTAAATFAGEPGSSAPRGGSTLLGARRKAERQTILQILEQCSDNRSLTAEVLGISRAALYKKLHQLGIA
jgi:DNA-binding NtrC family response regulator